MHPVLLGMLAAASWGTLDFLAGWSSRGIGYARTTAGVTIAGFILLTAALAGLGSFPAVQSLPSWIAIAAGAGMALATLCLFAALASGPMSLAIPVAMSYPATTVLVFAAAGSIPSLPQLMAVIAILGGAGIVALSEPAHDGHQRPGRIRRTLTFALLAHGVFLLAVLGGQAAAQELGALESAWISRIGGCLFVLPLLFVGGKSERMPVRILGLLGVMGLLDITGIAAIFAAGRTAQPEIATVCSAAAGAITVILAASILKERVKPARWAGIALVFTGISALSLAK